MLLIEILAAAAIPGGLPQSLPPCGPIAGPVKPLRIDKAFHAHQRRSERFEPIRAQSVVGEGKNPRRQIRQLPPVVQQHITAVLSQQPESPSPLNIRPANVLLTLPQMIGGPPVAQQPNP